MIDYQQISTLSPDSSRFQTADGKIDVVKYTQSSNTTFAVIEMHQNGETKHFTTSCRTLLPYLHNIFKEENTWEDSSLGKSHINFPELRVRDLRSIDWFINPVIDCNITVRKHCILMGVDPLRVIVTSQRILFLPAPDDLNTFRMLFPLICSSLSGWKEAQSQSAEDDNISAEPFELFCMETLFTTIQSIHQQNVKICSQDIKSWLRNFDMKALVPLAFGESMRRNKMELSKLVSYTENAKERLEKLLDDDDELMWMNLTFICALRATDISLDEKIEQMRNTDRTEILIESVLIEFNALHYQANNLLQQVESAQETLMLRLDTIQNVLLLMNCFFTLVLGVIGFQTFIVGAFAMNLEWDFLAALDNSFLIVFVVTFAQVFLGTLCAWEVLKYVKFIPS